MLVIYGLKNCDACCRTLKWLTTQSVDHIFRDIRIDGFSEAQLGSWINKVGWEKLLNRRSTTWRTLSDSEKKNIGKTEATALLKKYPSLIKRPIIEAKTQLLVGFNMEE